MKPSMRTPPRPDQVGDGDPLDRGSASGRRATGRCCRTCGRKRIGAGASGSTMQPVLDVEQLAAAPRRGTSEPRAQALHDLAQPGQPRPDPHVGHRRRPERREVAQDASSGSVSCRAARPSQTCAVVAFVAAFLPHRPRGGTWTIGSRNGRRRRASRVAVGPARRERLAELGRRAAALLDELAPAATSSSRSTPTSSFANGLLRQARSSTSCRTGRSARKSRPSQVERRAQRADPGPRVAPR